MGVKYYYLVGLRMQENIIRSIGPEINISVFFAGTLQESSNIDAVLACLLRGVLGTITGKKLLLYNS